MGLVPVQSGTIRLGGRDIESLDKAGMKEARRRVQMVFQDPLAALSPRRNIQQTLIEVLDHFGLGEAGGRRDRAIEALAAVDMDDSALARYPH